MRQEFLRTGGLEFLSISKVIDYDSLSKFIKEEFLKNKLSSEELNEKIVELNSRLEELKLIEKNKEEEYSMRQKQIAMYLECRRSFFGRIRYYFKGKKDIKEFKEDKAQVQKSEDENEDTDQLIYETREYYTIENLMDVTKILDRIENQIKNVTFDINALERSIDRLTKKNQNAKNYIDTIEEHKKSIFEFWSFVNKDNVLRIK